VPDAGQILPAPHPLPALTTAVEASPPSATTPSKPAETAAAHEPVLATAGQAMPWLRPVGWSALPNWTQDDHSQAWSAWLQSCRALVRQSAWREVCLTAQTLGLPDAEQARVFFEQHFQAYQVNQADGGQEGLVTGYYEPLLRGSRTPDARYRYPLHARPDDLVVVDLATVYPELKNLRLRGRLEGNRVVPYFTRGDIDAGKAPTRGLELAWVDDPIELFFLQVQGSGRLQLENGETMRIGYADQNGHPYRSIGRWLIDQGELTLDKASMQGIKDWARRNPQRLNELLAANPSYVFFRELANQTGGPLGSLGVPLTDERSIAVDPAAIPLGAPIWLATTQPNASEPLIRLTLAQDTGSAIRGNVRADFFWGFGEQAGRRAGAMKQKGRMWILLPKNYPLLNDATAARRRP